MQNRARRNTAGSISESGLLALFNIFSFLFVRIFGGVMSFCGIFFRICHPFLCLSHVLILFE